MHNNLTVLISAGGTGGHIFPALAVAQALMQKKIKIIWVGDARSMEKKIVDEHDIIFEAIPAARIKGQGFRKLFFVPFILLQALMESFHIIKRHHPCFVLTMGGFVTGPIGLAARLKSVPLFIHEQNSIAGLANRCLAFWAQRIFTGFPTCFRQYKKCSYVGNPLSKSICMMHSVERKIYDKAANRAFRILVLGGSLGAEAINELLPRAVAKLEQQYHLDIIHQSGERHAICTADRYRALCSIPVQVFPFLNNIAEQYLWADLVICRAGAMTISELTAAGVPSILIPFPYATDNHQMSNAIHLKDNGAALIFNQNKDDVTKLTDLIVKIIEQDGLILAMSKQAKRIAMLDATAEIVEQCLLAIKSHEYAG